MEDLHMTFLYLNSDRIGEGDDALGRKLMAVFLEKLLDDGTPIDDVVCVNGGVRLTTEGSDVLEPLEVLEERGTRISSCTTCLDHLGLRDKLKIGRPGTMDETVRFMATADRVIRP